MENGTIQLNNYCKSYLVPTPKYYLRDKMNVVSFSASRENSGCNMINFEAKSRAKSSII
jgi:hypothetical protein